MRHLLLYGLLALSSFSHTFAQGGIALSYIQPTGDYGYAFKGNVGIEFSYTLGGDISRSTTMSFVVGFYAPRPRLDSFPVWGYRGGLDPRFYPGYQTFSRYFVIPLGGSVDWRLMETDFAPLVSMDLYYFATFSTVVSDVPGISRTNNINGLSSIGTVVRVGGSYLLDDMRIDFGLGKSAAFTEQQVFQFYWKPFVRTSYQF